MMAALELLRDVERANGAAIAELYDRATVACMASGSCALHLHTLERFAECLAYRAMDDGVSWEDDHGELGAPIVPHYGDAATCELMHYAGDRCHKQTRRTRCRECGHYNPLRMKCSHC
jgi:hypothetical protein